MPSIQRVRTCSTNTVRRLTTPWSEAALVQTPAFLFLDTKCTHKCMRCDSTPRLWIAYSWWMRRDQQNFQPSPQQQKLGALRSHLLNMLRLAVDDLWARILVRWNAFIRWLWSYLFIHVGFSQYVDEISWVMSIEQLCSGSGKTWVESCEKWKNQCWWNLTRCQF